MGLTKEQMVHAIGITIGGNTAMNQGRFGTLSNWKDFAAAESSRKAIFSAQLAQAGMTGPAHILEGRSGFFNVIARYRFELPKLGEPWGIMRAFTKRFPLGQYSQTVAEAAIQVRPFVTTLEDVQKINLRVSKNAISIMADSPEKWRPQSHDTADHSMPYATAVGLMYGEIDEHYYEDTYLHDEKLLSLAARVHSVQSEEADVHERDYNLCDLELVLKSGQRKAVRVEYHRGHFKNPMTDAEMEEKFRSRARKHLSPQRISALLRQIWAPGTRDRNLERLFDAMACGSGPRDSRGSDVGGDRRTEGRSRHDQLRAMRSLTVHHAGSRERGRVIGPKRRRVIRPYLS